MSKSSAFHAGLCLAGVLSLMAVPGCAPDDADGDDEATDTAAEAITAGDAVQLERAALFTMSKYGFTQNNTQFHVAVANLDYTKSVTIVAQGAGGAWFEIPASYERSAGDNKEIWGAYTNTDLTQFAVRYTVLGQTYWDSQNGANYTLVGQGQNLYHGINVLAARPASLYGTSSSASLAAYVRNLAYGKQVNVVYTTDGWATVRTAPLGYEYREYYGYGSAASPDDAGIELWSGSFDVGSSASRIDYAVSYQVNGQTYWDNNRGANYVAYRQ